MCPATRINTPRNKADKKSSRSYWDAFYFICSADVVLLNAAIMTMTVRHFCDPPLRRTTHIQGYITGMCWGCVICRCQIDPCWLPRHALRLLCACVPCGCIPETLVITLCCCHPGNKTMGEVREREEQRQKERSRLAAAQSAA